MTDGPEDDDRPQTPDRASTPERARPTEGRSGDWPTPVDRPPTPVPPSVPDPPPPAGPSPAAPPPPPPDDAPAATEPGALERPPEDEERPPERIFVVAATQPPPSAADPDADVLYIVPAAQPQPDLEGTRLHPVRARDPEYAPRHEPVPRHEPAPVVVPAPVDAAEPPGRRRRPGCFAFLLLLVIAIVAGTAYAFRAGILTPRLVLNAAGYAAAEVEFVNLRDARVGANLTLANPDGESFPAAIRLEPFDIATHRAVRPSDLTVTLVADDGAPIGTCLLRLTAGARFRIVVLPEQALIQRGDAAPGSAQDLFLDSSSLCR